MEFITTKSKGREAQDTELSHLQAPEKHPTYLVVSTMPQLGAMGKQDAERIWRLNTEENGIHDTVNVHERGRATSLTLTSRKCGDRTFDHLPQYRH